MHNELITRLLLHGPSIGQNMRNAFRPYDDRDTILRNTIQRIRDGYYGDPDMLTNATKCRINYHCKKLGIPRL